MVFETETDLKNESRTLGIFCQYMKCDWQKLPKWDVDALLFRNGSGVGFAEVKNYTSTSLQYPSGMLSINKLQKLIECARFLPVVLIVNHADKLGYIKIDDISGGIEMGGRKPRVGSTNDIEWVIKFDKSPIVWIYDNIKNEFIK
jgi:hypothetical protein